MIHSKKGITRIRLPIVLVFVAFIAAACVEGGGGDSAGGGAGGGVSPGGMGGVASAGISSSPLMAAAMQNANALNQDPQFKIAQADLKELEDAGVLSDGDKDALQPLTTE